MQGFRWFDSCESFSWLLRGCLCLHIDTPRRHVVQMPEQPFKIAVFNLDLAVEALASFDSNPTAWRSSVRVREVSCAVHLEISYASHTWKEQSSTPSLWSPIRRWFLSATYTHSQTAPEDFCAEAAIMAALFVVGRCSNTFLKHLYVWENRREQRS